MEQADHVDALKGLLGRGLIAETPDAPGPASKRPRVVYELTAAGKEHFAGLVARSDATSWDDDGFDVRFAFFARTEHEVRLRILEGRRARLAEQLGAMRSAEQGERLDRWTAALHSHGEDATERAVAWLDELIDAERRAPQVRPGSLSDPAHPAFNPPPTKENP